MRIDLYVHADEASERFQTAVLNKLELIKQQGVSIMALFDALGAKVQKITDAADAMELVLEDVKKRLDLILSSSNLTPEDRAKMEELSNALDTEADDVIAKTLANTPAEPAP